MTSAVVPAVDAATVILVRERTSGADDWECFMVRRHVRSEFASDVFVFPGGKVDEADASPELLAVSVGEASLDTSERALRLAAIRELWEEANVLLVEQRDDELSRPVATTKSNGYTGLLHLAEETGCRYDLTLLQPFSRWITPESAPRRYDTRFYLGRLPHGQEPLHDGRETTAGVWIQPGRALERSAGGDFPLVFPTRKHLERLALYTSLAVLFAGVKPSDLDPVMPKIVMYGDETVFLLPGDTGY